MSYMCDICGKHPRWQQRQSCQNHTKRRWKPNLRRVRAVVTQGSVRYIQVCTRCLRSGKVIKPA